MPDRQDQYIEDLLDLLTSRVHRRRQQSRVPGQNGYRIIGEFVDDTGIGNQNETDNLIVNNLHILDCGHTFQNNLGGQCHYCDSLVCNHCISICAACGHSLCPQHMVMANFDGQTKSYCRPCSDEIVRSLKLGAIREMIVSFFVSDGDGKCK